MNDKIDAALGKEIELSEVLEGLRDELIRTQRSSSGKQIRFEVQNIEVELQTVVKRNVEGSAKGKIGIWVLSADFEGKIAYEDTVTQKVKLTFSALDLKVTDAAGKPQNAQVAGDD